MPSTLRIAAVAAAVALTSALTACAKPPAGLDLTRDKPSHGGLYRVAIAAPSPAPEVNKLHAWTIRLEGPDGQPVPGARFVVAGGMPQHGHGYPTKPRVTRELGDGSYLLEGMKFSMTGWWTLELGIDGERGADKVAFNIVVDPASGRP